MKSILCLSITIMMAGLAFVRAQQETPTPPPAGWTDSFETATNQAAKEGKDILVDFTGSDWCVWCRRLRSEVFDQPAFVAGVKDRFVLVEADYPTPKKKKLQSASLRAQNAKLAEEFDIHSYPTVFLLDSQGRPYAQTGYRYGGATNYLKVLDACQETRKQRDAAFQQAGKAQGAEHAKLLYSGLAMLALSEKSLTAHYGDLLAEIRKSSPELDVMAAVKKNKERADEEIAKEIETFTKAENKSAAKPEAIKLKPDMLSDNRNRFVTNCNVSSRVLPPGGGLVVVAEGDYEARSRGSYSVRIYAAKSGNAKERLFPITIDNFKSGLITLRENGFVQQVSTRDLLGDGREEIIVTIRSVGSFAKLSADAYQVADDRMQLIASVHDCPKTADVAGLLAYKLKPAAVGTPRWFEAVEAVVRVKDDEGHGPQVGSEEWQRAVSKKVFENMDVPVPEINSKEWFAAMNRHVLVGLASADDSTQKENHLKDGGSNQH